MFKSFVLALERLLSLRDIDGVRGAHLLYFKYCVRKLTSASVKAIPFPVVLRNNMRGGEGDRSSGGPSS